jgi:hypothetical protein
MAVTGHAAVVAFDAPVVVTVEYTLATRVALGLAGAVLPLGLGIAYVATDGESSYSASPRTPAVLAGLALVVFLAGVVALARGTVQARMLLDNREVDRVRWSFRPPRPLAARIGPRALGAQVTLGAERAVEFTVDGAPLKTAGVV